MPAKPQPLLPASSDYRTKDDVGFCVGSSQRKAQRLLALSFPWPLPVAPAEEGDALCSNATLIGPHLCGPQEIEQYYK